MGDITIRDAREAEFDTVAAVLAASYEQYMPADDVDPEMKAAFDGYRADIVDVRSRLHDSTLIVAEDGGAILGSVTFYPPRGNEQVGENWPAGWAAIRLLGVDPAARGRGIGRALTEECLRRARALGAPVMGLHTTELMGVAREMYKRMGFGRYPENDFYPVPEFCVEAYKLPL